MKFIALLDEDKIFLTGAKEILDSPDVCLFTINSLQQLKQLLTRIKLDVVIMDMKGKDYAALDTIRMIYSTCMKDPPFNIIILASYYSGETQTLKKIFPNVSILNKRLTALEFKNEISTAMQVLAYSLLSPREWQVFNLLCTGLTQKQASYVMDVNPKTFSTQKTTLQRKMLCRNRAELNMVLSKLITPSTTT